MWYEILAWILFAPLAALLEFVVTLIVDRVEAKRKWHPFADKYNKTLQDANEDNFSMIIEPNIKATILVGIIGFGFMWVVGVISVFAAYIIGKMKFVDCIIVTLTFSLICLPITSLFLHFFTKQVYFTSETIFIKTLFVKKLISVDDIVEVKEDKFDKHKFFRISNKDILIIKTAKYKIKITKNYSNYELAKNRFINLNLLRNSF